jgi:hypothetical protein
VAGFHFFLLTAVSETCGAQSKSALAPRSLRSEVSEHVTNAAAFETQRAAALLSPSQKYINANANRNTKGVKMKKLIERFEIGLEEIILALLILVEVFDFFALLPPSVEFAEKTISIIAMCYLFYKASLTEIVVGRKEKRYDLLIVLGFLLLSVKTIIGFAMSTAKQESMVKGLYSIILANSSSVEKYCFYAGILVLAVSAFMLVRDKVKRPSILWMIHEKNPENALHKATHFVTIYLVILSIFVTVFTFAFEWLAMTIDAAILMIILFFYLFVIVKRGKGMRTESFLKKVSDSSEDFYSKFVSLFHSRKTITVAITGLLVLHLLVDIGNFVIPYTTGLYYSWYLEGLGTGHLPLSTLVAQDFALAGTIPAQIGVMLTYLLNVLAVLMLLFGPAYVWAHIYKKQKVRMPNLAWLFFGSMTVFITEPVILIRRIIQKGFIGVDIATQQIPRMQNVLLALILSALVGGIFYILSRKSMRKTTKVVFAAVFAFFGMYIYHFFTSVSRHYIRAATALAEHGRYTEAAHLLIFFAIIILFYIGGFLLFLHELYIKQKI